MNRREFMACAVMLASNASLANMHQHGMSGEQKKYLASDCQFILHAKQTTYLTSDCQNNNFAC